MDSYSYVCRIKFGLSPPRNLIKLESFGLLAGRKVIKILINRVHLFRN